MTSRTTAPEGAPCWADLWTSDVEGSRRFYSQLLGWEAQEPSPDYGGYFMFTRAGAPVAGGMGSMGDMAANDTWKVYFSTPDVHRAVGAAEDLGAKPMGPSMPIADLGVQAVVDDPTGVSFGLWQPGTFHGFSVIGEPGAPSWFELRTTDYEGAQSFYGSVLSLVSRPMSDSDDFRYSTLRRPGSDEDLAGVMDAATGGTGSSPGWSIYWDVPNADDAVTQVTALGGSVVAEPQSTPYGRMATVRDPAGAVFRLRSVEAMPG